jgi:hypothetical protein
MGSLASAGNGGLFGLSRQETAMLLVTAMLFILLPEIRGTPEGKGVLGTARSQRGGGSP